jgi:hypothetical protein
MREPNWPTTTEGEVWKYVATHLAKNGIDTILVGGAVVAIYTEGAYRSGDLDFVLLTYLSEKLPTLMREIGFEITKGRHYKHPRCEHIFVEFASGPAGIGEDTKIKPAEVKVDGIVIKIFSPTDCIRDRLASYIHFKAGDCLEQAVLVACRHPYDRKVVRRWCADEGALDAFEEFERRLKLTSQT